MPYTYYDPEVAPDPKEWLALDEQERMRVVTNYHVANRIKVRGIKAHAAVHTIVENHIAQGYGPSKRALGRLQKAGQSRHDALHAICAMYSKYGGHHTQESLNAALDELGVELDAG